MKKNLLLLILTCLPFLMAFGQITYEDFETDTLPWNGSFGDGTFSVVANPPDSDPLGINPSANVGSYTKEVGKAYSLLIAVLDNPIDLSVNNHFKIQVNSPVATQFILKLEGTGEAKELTKNIAVTNKWIEYDFDFSSAAAFTTITKIILFFDPGVADSGDTYLFDNIVAYPADACAGTVPDLSIVDDFECQRNGTVGNPGYYDLTAVANPDPSGINTSDMVGRYRDTLGAFHALVYNWNSPDKFPLAEGASILKVKVWAPKAGNLLIKLEAGASPAIEVPVAITELNKWVEYEVDFTAQVGASYKNLVLFFNAGVNAEVGDIYYMDDLRFDSPPTAASLEDFEPTPKMFWESLGDEAIFGTFGGALANPAPNDVNDSPTVGKYTKGSSALGGLKATLPVDFSIAAFPQMNLQVWAPAGANELVLKLFSPSQGLKSVSQPIPATGEWVQLNFNFVDFTTITDFERVEISFDPDLVSTDVWYFDNLSQGVETVDPCADVEPITNIVDDFDCQRNVGISAGANQIEVVKNPNPGGLNPDPLDNVGQYTDPADAWSALVYDYGSSMDLSFYNQLEVLIYSPKVVPLLFKLEGGTGPAKEVFTDVTSANGWVKYRIDFSGEAAVDHTRLAIFFNAGVDHTESDVYYIDDVSWKPAPFTACVSNFETLDLSLLNWKYFANGSLEMTEFTTVSNPAPDAVNESGTVGVFLESSDGSTFAGMYADPSAPISMAPGNKTMTMKVWMDHAAKVTMKMEGGIDGAPGSGDNNVDYNTPNQWQNLTWDFSALPDNALYGRITLIFDIENIPTETKTYYFDDISVGGASCGTVGVFNPVEVARLKISPNPAEGILTIESNGDAQVFRVHNAFGQNLGTIQTVNAGVNTIDVSDLAQGVYFLSAYDRQGQLIGNAKFVKR